MKKLFKKTVLATLLLTVVACAGSNNGRYVQADNSYQGGYEYSQTGKLYGSDWH